MNSKYFRIGLILFIILINIGCDQQTKQMAKAQLDTGQVHSYWNDTFRLLYVENTGAFLSMGENLPGVLHLLLLKVFPVIMLTVLLFYTLFSKSLHYGQALAFGFIIGGGMSNLYDRIWNDGAVIDFMNMGIGELRTGIFNFADVSIMFGLGLFIFFSIVTKEKAEATFTTDGNQPSE